MAKIRPHQFVPPIYHWYTVSLHLGAWAPIDETSIHLVGYSLDTELPIGVMAWAVQPTEREAELLATIWAGAPVLYNICCKQCTAWSRQPGIWKPDAWRGENRSRLSPWDPWPWAPYPPTVYVGRIIYWPDWPP